MRGSPCPPLGGSAWALLVDHLPRPATTRDAYAWEHGVARATEELRAEGEIPPPPKDAPDLLRDAVAAAYDAHANSNAD
jgi:hypothetical protein